MSQLAKIETIYLFLYAVPVLVHRHIHPLLEETVSFHHANIDKWNSSPIRGEGKPRPACMVYPTLTTDLYRESRLNFA